MRDGAVTGALALGTAARYCAYGGKKSRHYCGKQKTPPAVVGGVAFFITVGHGDYLDWYHCLDLEEPLADGFKEGIILHLNHLKH